MVFGGGHKNGHSLVFVCPLLDVCLALWVGKISGLIILLICVFTFCSFYLCKSI